MAKGTRQPTSKKIVKDYDPQTKRTRTSFIEALVERRKLQTFLPLDDEVASAMAGIVKSSQRDSPAYFKAVENRRKQSAAGKKRGEIITAVARKRRALIMRTERQLRRQGHTRFFDKLIAKQIGLTPDAIRKIRTRKVSKKSGH